MAEPGVRDLAEKFCRVAARRPQRGAKWNGIKGGRIYRNSSHEGGDRRLVLMRRLEHSILLGLLRNFLGLEELHDVATALVESIPLLLPSRMPALTA